MKIMFVRPEPSPETIGLQHLMIVEPLELEILSALKRVHDTAVLIDMILEQKSIDSFIKLHQPDVLCVTGYITNVTTISDYCKAAKNISPNIVTVAGGVHCEVCPEHFDNEFIDFRVVRNAAIVFTQLLNHIENKSSLPEGVFKQKDKIENSILPAFDFDIPFADRGITEKYRHNYFYIFHNKVALIKTSFGCPFTCSFCFCREITKYLYHQRPLNEVMDELEMIREKEIYIVDDDFLADKKRLQEFIQECRTRNIQKHYLVYGRADFIAKNPELMKELAAIGLKTVIVGFESFSESELDTYKKNTNPDLYKKAMSILLEEKIECFATIILSPDWDQNDFRNMVKMVKQLGIHFVNLQPLTPLPNTGISFPPDKMILKENEYEKWDLAHVSIRPSKISVADFYRETLKAYNSILFQPKVLWKHLKMHKPKMLIRMLIGSYKVTRQYKKKIKEAQIV